MCSSIPKKHKRFVNINEKFVMLAHVLMKAVNAVAMISCVKVRDLAIVVPVTQTLFLWSGIVSNISARH